MHPETGLYLHRLRVAEVEQRRQRRAGLPERRRRAGLRQRPRPPGRVRVRVATALVQVAARLTREPVVVVPHRAGEGR